MVVSPARSRAAHRSPTQRPTGERGERSAPRSPLILLGWLLLGSLVLAAIALRQPQPGPEDPVRWLDPGERAATIQLQGRLRSDPMPMGPAAQAATAPASGEEARSCRVLLDSDADSRGSGSGSGSLGRGTNGASELILSPCPTLREGWRVRVEGTLTRPRHSAHPLLASSQERLRRQGVWSQVRVERLTVLRRPATPIADLRRRIAATFLRQAGPHQGGLLAALVLGSAVVPLPSDLVSDFRAAGLSHALAASGFHLTVLLGAVMALARPLGRAVRLAMAGLAIVLFLLLAGPQPSVVRAVLTGAVALVALEFGHRSRPLPWLALAAAVMLLLRPDWLQDVGFQLSVAATAGLLVSAGPLERALLGGGASDTGLMAGEANGMDDSLLGGCAREKIVLEDKAIKQQQSSAQPGPRHSSEPTRPRPSLPRRWLAAAVAVPLAATLWTLPLQVWHFGVLPLWAVPANGLAAPLLTPLTLGAMAVALLGLVAPPMTTALMHPLGWLASLLLQLAHAFAHLPMAQWQTGRPQPFLVAGLALGMLGWLLPDLGRRWRLLASGLLALVLALHVGSLRADALWLVRDGDADLLLARHQGRAALVTTRADAAGCRRAARLAAGLGLRRYDWLLSIDPVASADPTCWRDLAPLALLAGEDSAPLGSGQRLRSEGLAIESLSAESQALQLKFGDQRWLLLPDRTSLRAWRLSRREGSTDGLWLGFQPRGGERRWLQKHASGTVWISGPAPDGAPLPQGWQISGALGSLATDGS